MWWSVRRECKLAETINEKVDGRTSKQGSSGYDSSHSGNAANIDDDGEYQDQHECETGEHQKANDAIDFLFCFQIPRASRTTARSDRQG
jgi:hypothetical protein